MHFILSSTPEQAQFWAMYQTIVARVLKAKSLKCHRF